MYSKRRLIDRDHGSNDLPTDQSAELIQDLCRSIEPLAEKMPAGLEEILNTGDSHDAIYLFPTLFTSDAQNPQAPAFALSRPCFGVGRSAFLGCVCG